MNNEANYEFKLELIQRIVKISEKKNKKKYFILLFNIINKHDIKYTKNQNGIFFNLKNVNITVLNEIKDFLDNLDNMNSESETISISDY